MSEEFLAVVGLELIFNDILILDDHLQLKSNAVPLVFHCNLRTRDRRLSSRCLRFRRYSDSDCQLQLTRIASVPV